MSLFRGWDSFATTDPRYVPAPSSSPVFRTRKVSRGTALKQSAVWACLRLRADLMSTFPIDVFRRTADGAQVEVAKPPVLVNPGGERVDILEWLYSTQIDLDSVGNAFGLITERDAQDLPRRIDLVPATDVTVQVRDNVISYRIAGKEYDEAQVWHERQFTLSGMPVGLSPIAASAMSVGNDLAAQTFAAEWFDAGAAPKGILRNTRKEVDAAQADRAKSRFKATTAQRDIFVTGADWDYTMISAKASESSYIEQHNVTLSDVCRFLGVPGDLVDVQGNSASITYANITQRHLQLLVMHLNAPVVRREAALSRLLPRPRYVKFNTDALLRMDPMQRNTMLGQMVRDRLLTPTEARELDNRPPFTPEQIAEFQALAPTGGAPQTGAKP